MSIDGITIKFKKIPRYCNDCKFHEWIAGDHKCNVKEVYFERDEMTKDESRSYKRWKKCPLQQHAGETIKWEELSK